MPPPKHAEPAQVLLLTMTSVSDRISLFEIPPPFPPLVFCVTATLIRFSVTTLFARMAPVRTPPPGSNTQGSPGQPVFATQGCVLVIEQVPPAFPLRIVTPEMV